MSEEDKNLLLEMMSNCITEVGTYIDIKRFRKAQAINNALQEIERLNNIITELEKWIESETTEDYSVHHRVIMKCVLDKLNSFK